LVAGSNAAKYKHTMFGGSEPCDRRVWWSSKARDRVPARERSGGEIKCRLAFARALARGIPKAKAIRQALRVDEGHPDWMTPEAWELLWSDEECDAIANRWLKDPPTQSFLKQSVKRAGVTLAGATQYAVERLIEIIADPSTPPSTVERAARTILDRSGMTEGSKPGAEINDNLESLADAAAANMEGRPSEEPADDPREGDDE
jgi:hypothetical protein